MITEEEINTEFRSIISHALLGCDTSDIDRATWECTKFVLSLQSNAVVMTPDELKDLFYEYQSTSFRSDKLTTIEEFLKSKGILKKKVTIDFTIWCFENFRYYNKTNQVFVSSKFDEEGNETYNYATKEDAYSLYQIAVEKEFYET